MASILDIETGIANEWLMENGWYKIPICFSEDHQVWNTNVRVKTGIGFSAIELVFAYNAITHEITWVGRRPWVKSIVNSPSELENFIGVICEGQVNLIKSTVHIKK